MKNIKVIIVIFVIIILLAIAYKFISGDGLSSQDRQKQSEIDTMFAIWIAIAGEGDKRTMIQNEVAIKRDIYDKLNMEEILVLKAYSVNAKLMFDNKSRPFSPEFLGAMTYLAQNFNSAKVIASKTGIMDIFNRIAGSVPTNN